MLMLCCCWEELPLVEFEGEAEDMHRYAETSSTGSNALLCPAANDIAWFEASRVGSVLQEP